MNEIIFNLHLDGKTAFAVCFWGTIGIAAAKQTIKFVNEITKPVIERYKEQYGKFEN